MGRPTTPPPLTDLQRRIVWGIEQGEGWDDLAEHLGIAIDTVDDYEKKLRKRFGVARRRDLPAAVRQAFGPDALDVAPVAA